MTATSAESAAYIVAGLLFILSLAGLSRHETAKASGDVVAAVLCSKRCRAARIGKRPRR
jgi:NAD/NADP transhydrogenase beta subunit